MTFIQFRLLFAVSLPIIARATDYCESALSCNGVENSACNCDFGPTCKKPRVLEVTDDLRKMIVDKHNKYREKIASGSEYRGGMITGATDIFVLEYDRDLEQTATCWNKKCTFSHDKCRSTPDFHPAGQNLYYSAGKGCEWRESFKEAIYLWYEEVKDMTNDCVRAYASGCVTSKVGHFTQIIWSQTTHVGCSLVEQDNNACQIICNYGPAGNYQTQPVFIQGDAASDCAFKSSVYKHLCARNEKQARSAKLAAAEDVEGRSEYRPENGSTRVAGTGVSLSISKLVQVALVLSLLFVIISC